MAPRGLRRPLPSRSVRAALRHQISSRRAVTAAPTKAMLSLFAAAHPGPVAAVTSLSGLYAMALGRGWNGTLRVVAAVAAGQLSIGWQNDAIDAGRDALARRPKPIVLGRTPRAAVAGAALAAGVLCVPLSLWSGWKAGLVHLGAVGLGTAYNVGLKSTVASPLCYAGAFGSLPLFVALGATGAPLGPPLAPLAAALLGVGAHVMNTIPDRRADAVAGVAGLPQRLSLTGCRRLATACFVAAAMVIGLGGDGDASLRAAGLATGGGLALLSSTIARHAPDRAFAAAVGLATVDVLLLLLTWRGALAV